MAQFLIMASLFAVPATSFESTRRVGAANRRIGLLMQHNYLSNGHGKGMCRRSAGSLFHLTMVKKATHISCKNDCTEEDAQENDELISGSSDDAKESLIFPLPSTSTTDGVDASRESKVVNENIETEEGISSEIHRLLELLISLKEKLYKKIRRVLRALVTIITRSTQKTEAWIRDDVVGQLVSSALALVLFFVGVAAFAAWNIELLGGKKWAGPAEVTIPVVRVLESSTMSANGDGGIKIRKAQWEVPKIRTSYNDSTRDE